MWTHSSLLSGILLVLLNSVTVRMMALPCCYLLCETAQWWLAPWWSYSVYEMEDQCPYTSPAACRQGIEVGCLKIGLEHFAFSKLLFHKPGIFNINRQSISHIWICTNYNSLRKKNSWVKDVFYFKMDSLRHTGGRMRCLGNSLAPPRRRRLAITFSGPILI